MEHNDRQRFGTSTVSVVLQVGGGEHHHVMPSCRALLGGVSLGPVGQHAVQHPEVAEGLHGGEACGRAAVAGRLDLAVLVLEALPAVADLVDGEVDVALGQAVAQPAEVRVVALALLVQLVHQVQLLDQCQHGERVRLRPPLVGPPLAKVHGLPSRARSPWATTL